MKRSRLDMIKVTIALVKNIEDIYKVDWFGELSGYPNPIFWIAYGISDFRYLPVLPF